MTLRLRYLLVVAIVLALAGQGLAQGCEGWNTSLFFLSATPAEVESCLAARADVNARTAGLGYTPLHWAVRFSDNPAVITALLDAGANVNARDSYDKTPWDYARDREELRGSDAYRRLSETTVPAADLESPSFCAEWSSHEFLESATLAEIQACLEAGADVNVRTTFGSYFPLHWAVQSNDDPAIIEALIEAGADVNARLSDAGYLASHTPLHIAIRTAIDRSSADNLAIIEALIEAGADVNAQVGRRVGSGRLGDTPLTLALGGWLGRQFSDNPAIIEALIEAGADVNAREFIFRTTLLHLAASRTNNPAIITALVDAGAEVNARQRDGHTPLHWAARFSDNPAVIEVLLDTGADAKARSANGWLSWDYARDREELQGSDAYRRLATQAAAAGCEGWNTPEFFAFSTPAEVRACLAAGAWVNVRDDEGWTPLHLAALNSTDLTVIRILLGAGAEVHARERENAWTPLHTAAMGSDNPAIIQDLVFAGAVVDARDRSGSTPLHYAAGFNPNPTVARTLVNAGAWLEARVTEFGTTPLHMAASRNDNPAVITALLDAGADGAAQTHWGATPWDLAQDNEALRGTDAWWRLREGDLE